MHWGILKIRIRFFLRRIEFFIKLSYLKKHFCPFHYYMVFKNTVQTFKITCDLKKHDFGSVYCVRVCVKAEFLTFDILFKKTVPQIIGN